MRSMRLDCQNKYFPYGPKSRLIRALLHTYTQIKQYKINLYSAGALFTVLVRCPVHTPVRTPMYGLLLSQSDQRICSVLQSVYNKLNYSLKVQFVDYIVCDLIKMLNRLSMSNPSHFKNWAIPFYIHA